MALPDLAPGFPSRLLSLDVAAFGEAAPGTGTVTFSLPCDLRSLTTGTVLQARSVTVDLVDGAGEVRVPARSSNVTSDNGDDWGIIIRKSWAPRPYMVAIPSGTSTLRLGDLAPMRPLTAREMQWAVTNASVSVTTAAPGGNASGTVALSGGALDFRLTIPRGEQGLPGPGATAADTAVAGYVASTSATRTALETLIDQQTTPNLSAVSVKAYGARGDGSANDSSAFTSAINAAASLGVTVRVPPGTYSISNVTLPAGVVLEGSGPDTIIAQRDAGLPTMRTTGGLSTLGTLSGDVAAGATKITDPLIADVAAGDRVIIRDQVPFAATDSSYRSGEVLLVKSVSGTTATLERPVRGSFQPSGAYTTQNTAMLYRVEMVAGVTIRDMRFKGHPAGTNTSLNLVGAERVRVSDVATVDGVSAFMLVQRCVDVQLDNIGIHGIVDRWEDGHPGYGIMLTEACLDIRINNLTSTLCRHAVTTIGGTYGEPRGITIRGIDAEAWGNIAAIDTHSAGEGILITGGRIRGGNAGVTVRARNVTVDGLAIEGDANMAAGVQVTEDGRDAIITGCTITGAARGVAVGAGSSVHSGISIVGNTFTAQLLEAVRVSHGSSDIRVVRNSIAAPGQNGLSFAMSTSNVVVEGNAVTGVPSVANAVLSDWGENTGTGFDVVSNTFETHAGASRAVRVQRNNGRILANTAMGNFASTGTEFQGASGVTVKGNNIFS